MNKHLVPHFVLPLGAAFALTLGGCVTLTTHNHYAEDPTATSATIRAASSNQTAHHVADGSCNHYHSTSYSNAAIEHCQQSDNYRVEHHPTSPMYRDECDYRSTDYPANYPWRYGSHDPYVIYVPTAPQPNRNDEPARRTDAGGNGADTQRDGVQSKPRRTEEPVYRPERPVVLPTANDGVQSKPRRTEEPVYRPERPVVLPTANDGVQSKPRRTEEPVYRPERPVVLPTANDGVQSEPRRTVPVVEHSPQQTMQQPGNPTVVTGPTTSEPRRFQQSEDRMPARQSTVQIEAKPASNELSKPRRIIVAPTVATEPAAPAVVVGQAPVESTVRGKKQVEVEIDSPSVQKYKTEEVVGDPASTMPVMMVMPAEQEGQGSSVRRTIPR